MPKHILVVDDEETTLHLLEIQLKMEGYEVSTALDGPDALELFSKVVPDLVLLDVMLPEMDGIEVCQKLRSLPHGAVVPVIMLTARTEFEVMQSGFESGADDYIAKPFKREELLLRVKSHIERADRLVAAEVAKVSPAPAAGTILTHMQPNVPHNVKPFSGDTPTVTVVIPTLNEAENLPYVLPRIPEWIDEVIVVDGHSTDDTIKVAQSVRPHVRILMVEERGKGAALRAGFEAAKGDIIVMLDADGSTNPYEIPAYVGVLLSGADYAKGTRFAQGGGTWDMPLIRRLANLAFVMLVRVFFGGSFTDLCYGYNAFWTRVLPQLNVNTPGFEVETTINIHALRSSLKITEVPSFEAPRLYGIAKLQAIPDGWRVIRTILGEAVRKFSPFRSEKDAMIKDTSAT